MYDEVQAKLAVENTYPWLKIVDCFKYKNLFLVRVEHPNPDEANYDPFFSVNSVTGEIKEFSILTDADPEALMQAFQRR
jgi:hypothetical protein